MDYPCFVFNQRVAGPSPKFCIFEAPVGEILIWSSVPRLSPDNLTGVQRERNGFRVKSITKFLRDEDRNTIPTALVIALAPNAYEIIEDAATGLTMIRLIAENKDNVFVVDGQHRLYGLNEFDPLARAPVVAILDSSNDEKAFQFIVINNKAAKVAPDHIRALTFTYSSEELEMRLRTAKLSLSKHVIFVGLANEMEGSPFKNRLDLPNVLPEQRWVNAAAIESCVNYIQSKKIVGIDDEDSILGFFLAIWKEIETSWPEVFVKDSKLLSKVGMVTMNRYIVDSVDLLAGLLEDIDLSNEDDVVSACRRILKMQNADLWRSEWNLTISDSKVVRDQIYDALRRVQQNVKQNVGWFEEVTLVSAPWSAA